MGGDNFLVVFLGPKPLGVHVMAIPILLPKETHIVDCALKFYFIHVHSFKKSKWKISIITLKNSHHLLIDKSLLCSHEKFWPNWPKNDWIMAGNRRLKYTNAASICIFSVA